MGQHLWRFENIHISRASRPIIFQPLLTALERNFTGLQIPLRQIRRQHRMFPCQRSHRVDVFDDELAVRDPQFHICKVVRVKSWLLHCLVQRVEQRVLRLVDAHALIRQRRGLWIVAEDQTNGLLVGF